MAYFRFVFVLALFGACSAASEQSIEDMMANLKGMPGMEGVKMFSVGATARRFTVLPREVV